MRLKVETSAVSLIQNLNQWAQQLEDGTGQPGGAQWYAGLLDTIEESLRHFLEDADLAEGLFTSRYWHILQGSVPDNLYGKGVFRQECRYQAWRLRRACEELEALQRYAQGQGTVVVPDTNVLIHCGTLQDIDWQTHAADSTVRVIIPLAAVDELDVLKYTARERSDRTAIRRNVRMLNEALKGSPPGTGSRLTKDVTVAILPDSRGHRRMPSIDEEICDRAMMLRQFTTPVKLATNDNGMHLRALGYDLDTIAIPETDTDGS